ncbi:MAG: ferritin family protein [Chloroflexi bacterium]|nr:ferritin family protein [Chloroflexota bacterium]
MSPIPAQIVLQWALEIERNGEALYRAVAAQAEDREVKTLFHDLAYQEERHYRTFQRMLAKASEPTSDPLAADYRAFLEHALSGALTGEGKGMQRAKESHTEEEALRAAMAFEKDTLLFFYEVADVVEPDHLPAVRAIIDEERDHLRQLSRVLQDGPWVS